MNGLVTGEQWKPATAHFFELWPWHPAGDVTRVSVVPRKVTVKIGDAENRRRGCRDKNLLKKTKIPVRLVLSRVPFKFGV